MLTNIMDIIDLDAKIQTWAWEFFLMTRSKSQVKYTRERLLITIDWSRVRFNHSDTIYKDDTRVVPLPKMNNLFQTSFMNNTDTEQDYCFSTSRTTTSTLDIDISHTFTKEAGLELKMKIPGTIIEAGAGFKKQLSLTEGIRQTIQEDLTWSVNMNVKVKPSYKAYAEVKIQEKKLSSIFTITTEISGSVFVVYKDLKKNNEFIAQVSENIVKILKKRLPPARMIEKTKEMNYELFDDKVLFRTIGTTNFRFGAEQDVEVRQEKVTQ